MNGCISKIRPNDKSLNYACPAPVSFHLFGTCYLYILYCKEHLPPLGVCRNSIFFFCVLFFLFRLLTLPDKMRTEKGKILGQIDSQKWKTWYLAKGAGIVDSVIIWTRSPYYLRPVIKRISTYLWANVSDCFWHVGFRNILDVYCILNMHNITYT